MTGNKMAIAGFGFVGQAVYAGAKRPEVITIYDRYKEGYDEFSELLDCDFVFCCLPSPMDPETGQQDFTEINYLLQELEKETYEGIVIIKSTVLYNNIAPWFDKLNIVLNPEFLNQNTAFDDFKNQNLAIIGANALLGCEVREMYTDAFNLQETTFQIITPEEACWFKYLHNIYHAYQVLFWNYVHQLTGNSRKYTMLYEKLYNRKPILSQVCTDGQPGYGGACFPKDVNALANKHPHLLTEFMCRFNTKLRPEAEPPDPDREPFKRPRLPNPNPT